MAQLPTGSTNQIYTSLAAAKAISGISNATEAVVSSTAHGYSNGDVVFIESGWGRLNKRAYRIKSVATDSYVLEGCNTTNTTFYPASGGAGNGYKAQTPVQITQLLGMNSTGGDPKTVAYKYFESDVEYSINDGFTAVSRTMEIDADAIGGTAYSLLLSLTETGANTVLKTMTKNGSFTLLPCTVALNEEVVMTDGQVNRVRLAVNGTNRSTRYAS